jgi:hypothetical protein
MPAPVAPLASAPIQTSQDIPPNYTAPRPIATPAIAPVSVAPSITTPINTQLDPQVLTVMRAIRQAEGGDYTNTTGDGGASYGAFQWNNGGKPVAPGQTPANWQTAAQKYLGDSSAPMTPANQNYVAYHQILDYKNAGLTPTSIDALWNGAKSDPNNPGQFIHISPQRAATFQTNLQANISGTAPDLTYKGDPNAVPGAPTGNGTPTAPTYGATFPATAQDNGFVAGFKALGNIPSSVYGLGAGVANMLMHPINTVTTLGEGAIGGVENLTGQNPGAPDVNQQTANAIGKALVDRYGSLEALQNTATNDPMGFGTDIASLLAGGAGLVDTATGAAAKAGLLAEGTDVAGTLARAGEEVAGGVTAPVVNAAGAIGTKAADILAAPDVGAIEAAQRTGVTLPAGAMTTNPVIQRIEALATLGEGASNYEKIYSAAVSKMQDAANALVESTGGSTDLTQAGEQIAKGFQGITAQYKKATNALYDGLQSKIGDVAAQTQPALDALDSIISEKAAIGDTENLKWFQTKRDVLLGAGEYSAPTFTTLRKLKTAVGQMIDTKFGDPFVTTNIRQLKQLYGGIEDSIGATVKATGDTGVNALYKQANKSYIDALTIAKSQYAKAIQKLAANGQYDKLAEELIKPTTPIEDIPNIMAHVGEEGAANIRSGVMQKVFQNARNGEGDFTQKGILNQIKKFATADGRNRLESVLTPEQFQGMQDLGKVSDALGNVTKVVSGSQTSYLFRIAAEAGAVGWGMWDIATGNFVGGAQRIAGVGLSEGFSYFVTSPTGQRFLKWAIDHGSEIKAEASRLNLTPPADSATTAPNGNTSGNNPGAGGAGVAMDRTPGAGGLPSANGEALSPATKEPALTPAAGGSTVGTAGTPSLNDVVSRAAQMTKESGGSTINLGGDIPTSGFSFAPSKTTEFAIPEAQFSEDHLLKYAQDNLALLNQPGAHLGTWVDGGKTYMDISKVVTDEQQAVREAAAADQIGIFDLSKFETKYIKDYAKQTDGSYLHSGQDSGANSVGNEGSVAKSGDQGLTYENFPRQQGLSKADQKVEDASIRKYLENKDQLQSEYIAANKNVANTDLARPLFTGEGYKGRNSAAVQEASSAIVKDVWRSLLKNDGNAYIYAGGSGVGKSSAINGLIPEASSKAAAILDGNLSKISVATDRLKEVADAGKNATFVYVYREPVDAWVNGVIKRMNDNEAEGGRVVPMSEFLKNHPGSYETAKHLLNNGADIRLIDNSLGAGKADFMTPEKFSSIQYDAGLKDTLMKATKVLLEDGTINKKQYAALIK